MKMNILGAAYGSNLRVLRDLSCRDLNYIREIRYIAQKSMDHGANILPLDAFHTIRGLNFSPEGARDLLSTHLEAMGPVIFNPRNRIDSLLIPFGPQGNCYSDQIAGLGELNEFHRERIGVVREVLKSDVIRWVRQKIADIQVLNETVPTFTEAMVAMLAAEKLDFEEVTVSFVVREDGTLFDGMSVGEAIERIDRESGGWGFFGLNCSGMPGIRKALENAKAMGVDCRITKVYPNSLDIDQEVAERTPIEKLPKADLPGRAIEMARLIKKYPHIKTVGGCCGCTPEFICHLHDSLAA